MTRSFGDKIGTYEPEKVENLVAYCWNRDNSFRTGATFQILSYEHAQIMIGKYPKLAPAIRKYIKRGVYGNWFLIGVTIQSTKREAFKALLRVDETYIY